MDLSELTVRQVIAVNRVNRSVGTYTVVNRPYCALCYKHSGHSSYTQDGKKLKSDKNHFVFIPSGASYVYSCHEPGECIILEFTAENAGNNLLNFAVNNDIEIMAILDKIERKHTFKTAGYKEYCLSGLYRLLYYMISQNENAYISNQKKKRIQPGLEYLETHYRGSEIDISKLAEISDISEVYFRKLFTEIYGMSPKKYINLIRMTKAKELLLTKEVTVQQVAEEVGFRDIYSFCKAFRKSEDCTPSEYRKAHWV